MFSLLRALLQCSAALLPQFPYAYKDILLPTQDSSDRIYMHSENPGDPCWKCYKVNMVANFMIVVLEQDSSSTALP